ncbi:hypothetical protein [Streptomyces griseorubiginosus]|uniref:8-oxoguanine DNA glycosylase OGG fold protein n=1 Tax=Streptomyces griseorubiginosus TaxID=67304 RepID=UPI003AF3F3DE
MDRQSRADALDMEMATRLMPSEAVTALVEWWAQHSETYRDGPGAHAVIYTPSRWASITPWPGGLVPTSDSTDSRVSRAEVTRMVSDALNREAWTEALVATFVWGMGKSGTPRGSGPYVLSQILRCSNLDQELATAVNSLREHGAVPAYARLRGTVSGLGPSFFTKFLYFVGQALPVIPGRRPLGSCQVK